MQANKKIQKKIGFTFYQPKLVSIEKFYGKEDDLIEETWNASKTLEYFLNKNTKEKNFESEDIELDINTLEQIKNLYFFQLAKLRVDNVPSRKKIGEAREEIMLMDDEYIGEFSGILYDLSSSCFVIQNNRFGPSVKEIELYLNFLRNKYIEETGLDKSTEKMVKLYIVVDEKAVETIPDSKEIRKISLKSNTFCMANFVKDNTTDLKIINEAISKFGNVTFDISITAHVDEITKERSLEKNEALSFIKEIKEYLNFDKNGKAEVVRKYDDDSKVETIDFLLPSMRYYCNVSLEPRKAIGKDNLKMIMLGIFEKNSSKLSKLLAK
ncbi:DUF6731 family protein [Fusobacterium ulcerans]|uniref:DUF6731 family protein n=1 Tax=Fusobacterium ulcerans TaxID=861 RepID=UPI003FF10B31